jgi:hypothetical protein
MLRWVIDFCSALLFVVSLGCNAFPKADEPALVPDGTAPIIIPVENGETGATAPTPTSGEKSKN